MKKNVNLNTSEKCETCAKNWLHEQKIMAREIALAIRDCDSCKRNEYKLYKEKKSNV